MIIPRYILHENIDKKIVILPIDIRKHAPMSRRLLLKIDLDAQKNRWMKSDA